MGRTLVGFHQLNPRCSLSLMQVVLSLYCALLATNRCIMQADSRIIVEFPSKEGSQYALVGRERHAANADYVLFENW
jgi:hypothetical protein